MSSIYTNFVSAIQGLGLTPPDRVLADGKIHRFRSGPEHGLNGFYRLSIVPAHQGGEIGFGLLGCWKRDVREKWCSREPRSVSEIDHEAMERVRREQKRAEEAEAAKAASKAKWIWGRAQAPDPAHPYLAAKGIGFPDGSKEGQAGGGEGPPDGVGKAAEAPWLRGIRQYKSMLVIPVYRDGALASLQFIAPDGGKRFLSGGQVEGGYASVPGRSGSKDRIVVAEGYATAVSVSEATGLPVAVAFNAGNLLAVAKTIRAKYPDAEIIIAADNDQWTVVRGKPLNVGLARARAAAAAVGARVVFPKLPKDDPGHRTDFNDYFQLHGRDATLAAFNREPAADVPAQPDDPDEGRGPPPDNFPREETGGPPFPLTEGLPPRAEYSPPSDWRARLIPGKQPGEGHPFPFDPKSKTNTYLFLKFHHRFEGLLCYNEFTDAVMLARRPPWNDGADFSPRAIRDDDFFMLAANLEYCDISASKEMAADAAVRVAKENSINPPREFLSRLEWDERPRLDAWLAYYLGAEDQPADYLAMVGAKWLVGAVSRVFDPGCKFDSVLILEGSQGLGKSMALRSLATFHGQDFFLDSVGDIRSKDTLMTMQGKLIVEIAELASFRKTENEEIKAFITRQVDEYRPPYGRTVVKRPRYFVLAGSTNELDDGYLTDDTGNRRYWPVKCGAIDAEALGRDACQLWAEAVRRYQAGERTWLTREEAACSAREQKRRYVEDAWQDRIAEIVKHEWTVRIDDVLTKLELKPRDINNMVKKRVKNSLRQLGWRETRRAGEGRVWRPGEGDVPEDDG